jgi:FMN phosphatase YigB (HAD superfamily)
MNTHDADTDTFYILDFDRTLADTDKLLEVFIQVANQYIDLSPQQVTAADASVKQTGDSFDTASYVRDYLREHDRDDAWDQLERQFIHESRSLDMLLPGAAELLSALDTQGAQYGILTYGNPPWQHLKLTAAGFNHIPRIVITTKQKGILINSWQQTDHTFALPQEFGGGTAKEIVLVDDKAVSFDGFPSVSARGYWVLDPAHELPSQQGSVPANVARFANLSEVLHATAL